MKLANSSLNTIWRYDGYYKRKIDVENHLFLQESPTPIENFKGIFLKREDKSIVGSHKFRPLSYQLSCLKQDGIKKVTISSSGNAAITLSRFADKFGGEISIFISPNTPKAKKVAIKKSENCKIYEASRALRFTNYFAAKSEAHQLRASKDDAAVEGYKSLGFEMYEQKPETDAIFFFLSSGASLIGTFKAYEMLKKEGLVKKLPAFHAVLANQQEEDSLAGVCAKTHFHREKEVMEVIRKMDGEAWDVNNQEMLEAEEELKAKGIESSYESMAAFVACRKALKVNDYSNPVVIFSGKKWEATSEMREDEEFKVVESFEELDEIIKKS